MHWNNRLKKLEENLILEKECHIKIVNNSFLINDYKLQPYIPNKTGAKFHADNSFVRLILGPYASGKSTICIAEIILRAIAMPPCFDGVRRSRWALVRNTYGDLEATTLKTWLEWAESLGQVKRRLSPRLLYIHTFNDEKGPIELELMFIALDRPDHIRKLKSLELTGVYLNELSEIPALALTHFKARVNRFPAKRDCNQPYWSGIIADSNPPPTDHWMYNLFEIKKPQDHKLFHQPPAILKTDEYYEINPNADNLEHLMPNGKTYYMKMISGQSEEYIKVYAMGQYGVVVEGKFVYNNYNDDLHSQDSIEPNMQAPILLSWDYGTISPACLITQFIDGRLLCIKEFVCEYMTCKELYQNIVEPYLAQHCCGFTIEVIGDPADTYDGREALEECGLIVEAAKTNKLDPRIRAVRDLLNTLYQGQACLIISREGCPKLRQGFLGKYNYRRLRIIGEEKYQDIPNKTHPYSDIHDCLQYAALHYTDLYYANFNNEDDIDLDDLKYDENYRSKISGY